MAPYRHPDPDVWLAWLGTIGKWPEELKELGQEYAGCDCYRYHRAHVWIQGFQWVLYPQVAETPIPPDLFADVLQGKDSIYPGLLIRRVPVQQLTHCSCGRYMPPTREEAEAAQSRYKQQLARARTIRN